MGARFSVLGAVPRGIVRSFPPIDRCSWVGGLLPISAILTFWRSAWRTLSVLMSRRRANDARTVIPCCHDKGIVRHRVGPCPSGTMTSKLRFRALSPSPGEHSKGLVPRSPIFRFRETSRMARARRTLGTSDVETPVTMSMRHPTCVDPYLDDFLARLYTFKRTTKLIRGGMA